MTPITPTIGASISRWFGSLLLAGTLLALLAPSAFGQGTPGSSGTPRFGELQSNVPGTYYHAEPGEETIEVIVWGAISNRGRYQVPVGTDLGEFMALAGGPNLNPRSRSTNREVTLTVSRKINEGREIIFTLEGESLVETDQRYPTLEDRDIVTVRVVEWQGLTVGRAFRFLGSLASMALVIDRIIRF